MEFTTCFDQESQPSRLLERMLKHSEHRVIDGILTLHDPFFQRVMPGYTWLITRSLDYNSVARLDNRFNVELFPLHSPLLGESLLVSFPPLNNMLKFGGSSRFIRDQVRWVHFLQPFQLSSQTEKPDFLQKRRSSNNSSLLTTRANSDGQIKQKSFNLRSHITRVNERVTSFGVCAKLGRQTFKVTPGS